MKQSDERLAAEMQLPRFAHKTNGLQMNDMRLRVLSLMDLADRYTLLGLMDDMMDELAHSGVRALGPNVQNLTKRQAMLLLADLRRWLVTMYCNDAAATCDRLSDMRRRVKALEAENTALREQLNDGWTGRVTYDAMVEQIAACEDTRERDDARKLIEPMLKRDMARRFREDIRLKVQQTHTDDIRERNQTAQEIVLHKYVENEFHKVEQGGIGINK